MTALSTTLIRILPVIKNQAAWSILLAKLGKKEADDDQISFEKIVRSAGLEVALLTIESEPQHAREYRLFAVACVRPVEHLLRDPDSERALDDAGRHALGLIGDTEFAEARRRAECPEMDARNGRNADVAPDAIDIAVICARSAVAAACHQHAHLAALSAASEAAEAAGWAAEARWERKSEYDTTRLRLGRIARDAAIAAQTAMFIEITGGTQ